MLNSTPIKYSQIWILSIDVLYEFFFTSSTFFRVILPRAKKIGDMFISLTHF